MGNMLLRYFRPLVVTLAFVLLIAPSAATAQSPQDDLAGIATHIDTALQKLAAGDTAGAASAYQAFEDGWFAIEDGVRDVSLASYAALEGAMGDAKYPLTQQPVNTPAARAGLLKLQAECAAFIAGQLPISGSAIPAPSTNGEALTVASVTANLDVALKHMDAGNAPEAAKAVALFRQQWPDVEGFVKAKSAKTYTDTENNMTKAYSQLTQQTPDVAGARVTINQMKTDLTTYLSGDTSYGIFDAFIILFREGLEALLVVAALLAFLKKAGHADKGKWIWAGGAVGIVLSVIGALVINIIFSRASAGANRELLEGGTGLIAAVMLLYMSYWLHSKSSLGAWHRYIQAKGTAALARNSLLSLGVMSFLAVFREGAETILFYIGIAPSISTSDLLLGIGIASVALAIIGMLIMVFGVRVPIRQFFMVASALIYFLAFKFVGTGVHALQVAGYLQSTPADFVPTNQFLGIYPNWEGAFAQGFLILLGVAVIIYNQRRGHSSEAPSKPVNSAK